MYAHTAHQHGFLLPDRFEPLVLGALAIGATLFAWAAFGASTVSNENHSVMVPAMQGRPHSIAYIQPTGSSDSIYVRADDGQAPGRLVAAFPSYFNIHARGAASPDGDTLAVLSLDAASGPLARLSVVALPGGEVTATAEGFDYLSPLAWSRDGNRVVVRRSTAADEAGRVATTLFEVSAGTADTRPVGSFESVFEAAPLGYSLDGERLFIAVIDQSGSSLWAERAGRLQRLASLSPGRTRDWSLSPDGARLAFVDILGAGERSYAGRSLVIATGRVTDVPAAGNQLGATWMSGSQVPSFGGPGGSLQLSSAKLDGSFIVPNQWSPDGSSLVATIYSASGERAGSPSLELVTPERRTRLSAEPGASFLGWVGDLP